MGDDLNDLMSLDLAALGRPLHLSLLRRPRAHRQGDVRGAHWNAESFRHCVPRLASGEENPRGTFRGDIPDRYSRRITFELSAPHAGAMCSHFIVHGCARARCYAWAMTSTICCRLTGPLEPDLRPSLYSGARALTDEVLCEAPTGAHCRYHCAFPASPPAERTRAGCLAAIFPIDVLDA